MNTPICSQAMSSAKKNRRVLEEGEVSKRLGYWSLTKSVTPDQMEEFWSRVEQYRVDHRPYRLKRFPPHLIEYLDNLTNLGWFDVSPDESEDISKDIMIEMECPDLYQEFRHMLRCLREKDFPDACMILKPEHITIHDVLSDVPKKVFPRIIPYLLVDKSPIPPDPSGFPEIQGDLIQITELARQEPLWNTHRVEYFERSRPRRSCSYNSLSNMLSSPNSASSVKSVSFIPKCDAPQKRIISTASTASFIPMKRANFGPPRRSFSTASAASGNVKGKYASGISRAPSTCIPRSVSRASPAARRQSSGASMTSVNSITSTASSARRNTISTPQPRWK